VSPPSAADYHRQISTEIQTDDLNRIKWAGWLLLGGLVCWAVAQIVDNTITVARIEERQNNHYLQLREDIAELKLLLSDR
jgi:hypothetical protein